MRAQAKATLTIQVEGGNIVPQKRQKRRRRGKLNWRSVDPGAFDVSKVMDSIINAPYVGTELQMKAVLVTPKIARLWLLTINPKRQRGVSGGVLTRYISDMKRNSWKNIGDTIKFDRNWNLCDGQHRLESIIRSGLSQVMIVVWNVDPEHMRYIDNVFKRSPRQIFDIVGWDGVRSRACEMASIFMQVRGNKRPSVDELLECAEEHRESFYWVQDNLGRKDYFSLAGVRLALAEMYERDPVKSEKFLESFKSGLGLVDGSPVYALRRFLEGRRCSKSHESQQLTIYKKSVYVMQRFLDGLSCKAALAGNWSC